jgi:hypothetical protein
MAQAIPDFVRRFEQYEKRRAEKISLFFKLIKDPIIQPYLELLRDGEPKEDKKQFVPPPGFKSGNGLRSAIRALALPQRFTARQTLEVLRKQQFHFSATDELGAVGHALYAMSQGKRAEFRRIPAQDGQPAQYERI